MDAVREYAELVTGKALTSRVDLEFITMLLEKLATAPVSVSFEGASCEYARSVKETHIIASDETISVLRAMGVHAIQFNRGDTVELDYGEYWVDTDQNGTPI